MDPSKMSQTIQYPPIDQQIRELIEAGWLPISKGKRVWRSPQGSVWIGPHGAWKGLQRDLAQTKTI